MEQVPKGTCHPDAQVGPSPEAQSAPREPQSKPFHKGVSLRQPLVDDSDAWAPSIALLLLLLPRASTWIWFGPIEHLIDITLWACLRLSIRHCMEPERVSASNVRDDDRNSPIAVVDDLCPREAPHLKCGTGKIRTGGQVGLESSEATIREGDTAPVLEPAP